MGTVVTPPSNDLLAKPNSPLSTPFDAYDNNAAEASMTQQRSPHIERPKSPYPSSYSVTRLNDIASQSEPLENTFQVSSHTPGPDQRLSFSGLREPDLTLVLAKLKSAAEAEDSDDEILEGPLSEARSDIPEVPGSPRSDLGILTPSFDTRSEVSVASHEPIAPSSPRLDPEAPLVFDEPPQTPIVMAPPPPRLRTANLSVSSDAADTITPLPTPHASVMSHADAAVQAQESEVSVLGDISEDTINETLRTTVSSSDLFHDFVVWSLNSLTFLGRGRAV